ncbi:MAG: hypothetical protein JNL22_15890 [Bacteroidales bacterium]|jgi:hypothetical protein|nr:hypothetical protein [Bacteroidales bacterium]
MNELRNIRDEEKLLIQFLLSQIGLTEAEYPIAQEVSEYEGGFMGSISMAGSDPGLYDGDLVQVEYTDADGVEVIISLTRDKNGRLLDLDFWKTDFSKLRRYPTPEALTILRK